MFQTCIESKRRVPLTNSILPQDIQNSTACQKILSVGVDARSLFSKRNSPNNTVYNVVHSVYSLYITAQVNMNTSKYADIMRWATTIVQSCEGSKFSVCRLIILLNSKIRGSNSGLLYRDPNPPNLFFAIAFWLPGVLFARFGLFLHDPSAAISRRSTTIFRLLILADMLFALSDIFGARHPPSIGFFVWLVYLIMSMRYVVLVDRRYTAAHSKFEPIWVYGLKALLQSLLSQYAAVLLLSPWSYRLVDPFILSYSETVVWITCHVLTTEYTNTRNIPWIIHDK